MLEPKLTKGTPDYTHNKAAIALALDGLGKHDAALEELELGLATSDQLPAEVVLNLFSAYARIVRSQGWTVPSTHRDLLMRAVAELGIPVTHELIHSSVTEAILAVIATRRQASKRFSILRQQARGQPTEVAESLIRAYIDTEPVGFYRDMARRWLDEI